MTPEQEKEVLKAAEWTNFQYNMDAFFGGVIFIAMIVGLVVWAFS